MNINGKHIALGPLITKAVITIISAWIIVGIPWLIVQGWYLGVDMRDTKEDIQAQRVDLDAAKVDMDDIKKILKDYTDRHIPNHITLRVKVAGAEKRLDEHEIRIDLLEGSKSKRKESNETNDQ